MNAPRCTDCNIYIFQITLINEVPYCEGCGECQIRRNQERECPRRLLVERWYRPVK